MATRKHSAFKAFMIGMARSDDIDRVLTRRFVPISRNPKWKSGLEADQESFRRDLQALSGDRVSTQRKLSVKLGGS